MENKTIAQAKKNLRDYKVIDKFVAGIVLTGNEIKSVRSKQLSINEAYALPQNKELYIINMHIAIYKYSRDGNLVGSPNTRRRRKLLLQRKEIDKIIRDLKTKRYSLIPLQIFLNEKGWAKLEIALAQRLRKYQIKEKLKEKDLARELKEEDF